jgi:hypothetical protein
MVPTAISTSLYTIVVGATLCLLGHAVSAANASVSGTPTNDFIVAATMNSEWAFKGFSDRIKNGPESLSWMDCVILGIITIAGMEVINVGVKVLGSTLMIFSMDALKNLLFNGAFAHKV